MNQEHHNKDPRTNWKGSNYDSERELTGSQDTGEYLDAHNMRGSSTRGNRRASEKIRGEEVLYPVNNTDADWCSIGMINVKGHIIEAYVDPLGVEAPIIRIDGNIVAQSDKMPWVKEFPFQMDKNESCSGGEFFVTDFNTPPAIYNVEDMIDSLLNDPTKYFSDYNHDLYTINLDAPLDIPVFVGLRNLGGGGGLPVGSYQYSLRYINDDGDATNWGPLTPPIPVVQSLSSQSPQYPYTKTYGDDANITAPTAYGPVLKFRVTNLVDYDFIEVRRISYNVEAGVDVIPQGEIVAKIGISPGEISVREYVDPFDSNVEDTLADSEEVNDLSFIQKAKGIRYHDKRLVLMNIETADKDADISVGELNGKKSFPIMEALGKPGHNDPVNHTYKKSYMGGEKYSFAVNLFDGLGGSGFAVEDDDLKNIEFPNRRDIPDSDSQAYSYGGMVTAANINSGVGPTFEVFDLEDGIQKNDLDSFKNILDAGSKSQSEVNTYSPDAGHGLTVSGDEIGYNPYRPTDKNDSTPSHDYRVNVKVDQGSSDLDYSPNGFAPNYFSRGLAIPSINNLPSWAKSFSIVRSDPADRVICQGIGFYSMTQGDFDLIGSESASKDRNKILFASPDIESGLINTATIQDIADNPQNYKIQLVSPLGFFSEVYGFENNLGNSAKDRLVDMITYARLLKDNGEINPGESGVGVGSYVAYNKYRNDTVAGGDVFSGDNGNKEFSVSDFQSVTEGRSTYYSLSVNENIYNEQFTGGPTNNDFEDDGLKDWTEPLYIVNIIQTGKEVKDQNINDYKSTGHYQKIESIIGESSGLNGQSFELVDERWEDCIPDQTPSGPFANEEVFVYIKDSSGNYQTYINVTYMSTAQKNNIINDISLNGFYLSITGEQVVGLYEHSESSGVYSLEFNYPDYIPASESYIIVRYDTRRPLRVFGGDVTVSENIFCPIDREADASTNEKDSQFVLNCGFPFRKYELNPRHYIVEDTTGIDKIQGARTASLGFIRQMCVMYNCESRISSHYSHSNEYPLQHFPMVHYVMRPNRFDDSSFDSGVVEDIINDNNLHDTYLEDYPNEYAYWKFGGFRFLQEYNVDYSSIGPSQYFSKPKFGFDEQNKFCTRIVWSLPRAINQQDSPGLKTFSSTNVFDADDDNGEIKKAWDARTSGKGENLYAICESGIVLLLTKKSVLSNVSGNDLTTTAADNLIGGQYWLSHDIGSNDEMWRGMAEESVENRTETGRIEADALFIPNKHSVYRLMENVVKDITKDTYFNRLNPVLKNIRGGYLDHVTAFFDKINNDYWLEVKLNESVVDEYGQETDHTTFMYSHDNNRWWGTNDFKFDRYLYLDNGIYGTKGLQTFILDKGFLISQEPIEAYLVQLSAKSQANEKEAIDLEVNTGVRGEMKPSKIEFVNQKFVVQCTVNEATNGPLYLKQYDGWWTQVPRKDVSVSPNRDRLQSRLFIYKIFHNFEEDFKIVDTVLRFKTLK